MKKIIRFALVLSMAVCLLIGLNNNEIFAAKSQVNKIKVTNLPAKSVTLELNEVKRLKIKVDVKGKASKKVTYKSSKPNVVKVSKKGTLSALKKGKATITITAKADKRKKIKVKVIVGTPVKSVSLSQSVGNVKIGKKLNLKATVKSSKASNKKIVWTSSNKKVAKVNSKGVVTGLNKGVAKITATAADGSGRKKSATITVTDTKFGNKNNSNDVSGRFLLNSDKKDYYGVCEQNEQSNLHIPFAPIRLPEPGYYCELVDYKIIGLPEGINSTLGFDVNGGYIDIQGIFSKAGDCNIQIEYTLVNHEDNNKKSNYVWNGIIHVREPNEIWANLDIDDEYIFENKLSTANINAFGGSGEYLYEVLNNDGDSYSIDKNALNMNFKAIKDKNIVIKVSDANDKNNSYTINHKLYAMSNITGKITDVKGKNLYDAKIKFKSTSFEKEFSVCLEQNNPMVKYGYYQAQVPFGTYDITVTSKVGTKVIEGVVIGSGRTDANIVVK